MVYLAIFIKEYLWLCAIILPLLLIGFIDVFQKRRTIRRNFPILGHFRYFFEMIRPEINQYFVESNTDGKPISREQRSLVYQRAKSALDTLPFGTKKDVYAPGYQWVNHSMRPLKYDGSPLRINIGGPDCLQPYSSSILNISGMSYGSLSKNAVLALSHGAKMGGFGLTTGEGGLTKYHLEGGADVIWQVGTGYFGCRTPEGNFSADEFAKKAQHPQVKMIEIKLSQGAKPGHGGVLPAKKVTAEIAAIRGVPVGKDVNSPPAHSAFETPRELLKFIKQLRNLSGGKPIGIKFCLGKKRQFISLCKAMLIEKIMPDYLVIDGGEGGTGAAPLEFSNHVGYPLKEAIIVVHNALVGFDLRKHIRVVASSGVFSGFDIIERISIGADACNSARGMMLALGCIQALRCNTNRCPTGIATQNPQLVGGLDVKDKSKRVFQYHYETIHSVGEILAAMGLTSSTQLRPWHIMRRFDENTAKHYGEIFNYLKPGDLLSNDIPKEFAWAFAEASADSF